MYPTLTLPECLFENKFLNYFNNQLTISNTVKLDYNEFDYNDLDDNDLDYNELDENELGYKEHLVITNKILKSKSQFTTPTGCNKPPL